MLFNWALTDLKLTAIMQLAMTIMEALKWASAKLKKEMTTPLDSPLLDAEVLLAFTLSCKKPELIARMNETLNPESKTKFCSLLDRRIQGEPAAYLIGKKEFYGRSFCVTPSVLIPRPATETLIDLAKAALRERDPASTLFLDIGTGPGTIALTLALESSCPVIGTDISSDALTIAKQNAKKLNAEELTDFREGNLLDPIFPILQTLRKQKKEDPLSPSYDHLILCANLPYLTTYQLEKAQKDVRDYEPHLALVAGPDGMDCYWALFKQIYKNRILFPHDMLVLIEIDPSQTVRIKEIITHFFPHAHPEIHKDLEGHDRIVKCAL
jgi:release factor glutamine methyltransferase